ncbi:hypothetical protein PM082_009189 [Marasmius tenuissimus]|nr:hypothetical protein PM082_009189 [Marasmius tenuissimus]
MAQSSSHEFCYIFLWPDDADPFVPKVQTPTATRYSPGIYPQCPFVPGGGGGGIHWLPVVIQVPRTAAHQISKLLQLLVNELKTISDRDVLMNCFQFLDSFQEACEIMETHGTGTFWAFLIAKDTAVLYDHRRTAQFMVLLAKPSATYSSFAGAFFGMITQGKNHQIDLLGQEFLPASQFPPPVLPCTSTRSATVTPTSVSPATNRHEVPPTTPKRMTTRIGTAVSPSLIHSPLHAAQAPRTPKQTGSNAVVQKTSSVSSNGSTTDVDAPPPIPSRGENVELVSSISHQARQYFTLYGYPQENVGILIGLYNAATSVENFCVLVASVFRNLPEGEFTYI